MCASHSEQSPPPPHTYLAVIEHATTAHVQPIERRWCTHTQVNSQQHLQEAHYMVDVVAAVLVLPTFRASIVLMYGSPSRARLSDNTLKKSFNGLFWGSS